MTKLEQQLNVANTAFEKNSENFYREIRRYLREVEADMDETTTVQVYVNFDFELTPYFKFIYQTEGYHNITNYFPPNFKRGHEENIEIDHINDIEIKFLYGHQIPKE